MRITRHFSRLRVLALPASLLLLSTATAAPDAVFSTYLGGSGPEHPAGDMVIDDKGFIYITGTTRSADFPVTKGAFDTSFNDTSGNSDAFVAKLDPDGSIIWSTFIGTPTRDEFNVIKVDDDGYVYLAGAFGPGAPTTPGALQRSFAGAGRSGEKWDGYLVKLKPDGSGLVWATYLGTTSDDSLRGMDIDAGGNAVVVSRYKGGQWPSKWFAGAFQDKPKGGVDTVILKISSDGKRVLWGSYLGGSGDESTAPNVCLDKAGRVHVLTSTRSVDIPTTAGAYDRSYNGDTDIYVATLSSDGRELLMGTYLGTPENEGGGGKRGIQVDPDGSLVISGWTRSSRFPTTPGAYRSTALGYTPWGATGVTARFSPAGELLAATYIGDSEGLSLDSHGNAYIAFKVWDDILPSSVDAFQSKRGGKSDGALVVLSADLKRLIYATYLGGSGEDGARITAVGADDSILVSGETGSTDLPTLHAYQAKNAGDTDVFLVKFSPLNSTPVSGQ
jgi:hypothetical protein